jgi:hypothetical protein
MEQKMAETTLLALFEDLDPAAAAIAKLHELGVTDDRLEVISGVPISHRILGRPHSHTNVPRLALGGAVIGSMVGLFLNFGTPNLYGVRVGGQPLTPIPPGLIIFFEMTMLFALLATFLGVFLDSYFPNYRPLEYVPEISDGKIGLFFKIPPEEEQKFTEAMNQMGAEAVRVTEAMQL